MGTTLWFDAADVKNEKLKSLVATGQFTMCANLLDYTIKLQRDNKLTLDANVLKLIEHIREQLEKDWAQFKANPYFLYEKTFNQ